MQHKELLTKTGIAQIGEEIGLELGHKLVNDFKVANPGSRLFNVIGKNIIETILSQPGCEGIRFYNAINEEGQNTLVYVGVDYQGLDILTYTIVKSTGNAIELVKQNAIVADRTLGGTKPPAISVAEPLNPLNWD
jgi:hypothetical protein